MIFAIGSIGFFLLWAAVSVVIVVAEDLERFGLAGLGLVAAFTVMALWGDFNVIEVARSNPLLIAELVGGYFVAGTVWAIIKWWFFVRDCRYRYEEDKAEFLTCHGIKGKKIPDELLAQWKRHCEIAYGYGRNRLGDLATAPQARHNKARIMRWMMFWPWSAVWTIINDPIKKLFKRIYRTIQGLLQAISDRAYRGVDDDFREVPKDPEGDRHSELRAVSGDEPAGRAATGNP